MITVRSIGASLVVIACCGGVACALWWSFPKTERTKAQAIPREDVSKGADLSGSDHSSTPGSMIVPTAQVGAAAGSPSSADTNVTVLSVLDPKLERILSPEHQWRLDWVPELDQHQEQTLIKRFKHTTKIPERYRLMLALVYGGGQEVTSLITNALTDDYAGVEMSRRDSGRLTHMYELLGWLANTDSNALDSLLASMEPGFWETQEGWSVEGRVVPAERLREAAVVGLGYCLLPEAELALHSLRDNPDRARELGLISGVTDAAFIREKVERYGLKEGLQHLGIRSFEEWTRTTNGQWWMEWYEKHMLE